MKLLLNPITIGLLAWLIIIGAVLGLVELYLKLFVL